MKFPLFRPIALCLLFVAPLLAQEGPPPGAPLTSPDELDQALGPIALYPDALIALILPAATDPSDVVLAARYLQDGGDPADTDDQPWDDSLKALARYPDVVKWMDQNLAWTKQVGVAFLDQPDAVMSSIQHLRQEARASGALTNTPQQELVMDGSNISIMPAQPDTIYVPDYDPDVVYVSQPGYSEPYMTFGVGYPTGFWLGYDLDWGHRRIWTVDPRDRERYWRDHRDWRHPAFPGRPDYVRDPNRHPWKPSPGYQRPPNPPGVNRPDASRPPVQRPAPFPNSPPRPNNPPQNRPDRPPGNRDQVPPPNRRPEPQQNVSPRPGSPPSQPQPQPGRSPMPAPGPQPQSPSDNRGRDSRDNPQRPPVIAPPRQAPPAARPPPPPAPAPARDDKQDDDKKR